MKELEVLLQILGITNVTVTGMLLVTIVVMGLYIWRVLWPERKELDAAADAATEKLHDARLVQLRAELRLDYVEREQARCERNLDLCERRTDQWQTSKTA